MNRYARLRISAFIAFLAILNTSIFAPVAPCFASIAAEICQVSVMSTTMDGVAHEGHEGMPDSSISVHSPDHQEGMAGGHCGMMEDEEEVFPPTPSGHQCTHHTASSKDTDATSLYCNCHAHGPESVVNSSPEETRYLEPVIVAALADAAHGAARPFVGIFISNFKPDPLEKPPASS